MAQTYDLIASATADGSSASVAFTSIPQTYDNLHLYCSVRSTSTNTSECLMQVVPDTSSTWTGASLAAWWVNFMGEDGSPSISGSGPSNNLYFIRRVPKPDDGVPGSGGMGSAAEYFGSWRIDLPDYKSSQAKGIYAYGGSLTNATKFGATTQALAYVQTGNPFVSVTFTIDQGNFDSKSKFRLYGTSNS